MTHDELIEQVARKIASCRSTEHDWERYEPEARAVIAIIRPAVLEEAARVAEDVQDEWRLDVANLEDGYASEGIPSPAAAIRALTEKTDG